MEDTTGTERPPPTKTMERTKHLPGSRRIVLAAPAPCGLALDYSAARTQKKIAMMVGRDSPQKALGQETLVSLGSEILQKGTSVLFPPLSVGERTSPSQPAMFLVYLCGTWLVEHFVILILGCFGLMANPSFPWGFLRAVQPGVNTEFFEVLVSLLLTLVVYARFFYRYNDYLYHLNPTKTPLGFVLDCLVATSGVAIIVAVGNSILLAASFSALFMFAGLKYLQGFWVCRSEVKRREGEMRGVTLWRLNSIIMKRKFAYDVVWSVLFFALAIAAIPTSRVWHTAAFAFLIPMQLAYMYFGDPVQIALRDMNLAPRPWPAVWMAIKRVYGLSRPYSLPYVALLGVCGAS